MNLINELSNFDSIIDEFTILIENGIELLEAFKTIENKFGKEEVEFFLESLDFNQKLN
jgi:hypothetical protein